MTSDEQLNDMVAALSIHSPPSVEGIDGVNGMTTNGTYFAASANATAAGSDTVDEILREIAGLSGAIYEIEELRHAGPSTGSPSTHSSRVDTLLVNLDAAYASLSGRRDAALPGLPTSGVDEGDLAHLQREWEKMSRQYMMLKDEMKEDGWLVRFRTTAGQADAMMEPMQKSLNDCLAFLRAISSLPDGLPEKSDSDDQPSVERLEELARSHESMKTTYVPSVARILKMMNKSIQERSTRNGEALRRLSEMESRWSTLSRQLQQLDGKFRVVLSQYKGPDGGPTGDVELLAETSSVLSSPTREHFGIPSAPTYGSSTPSHRSSISSNHSGQQIRASLGLGRAKSPATQDANRTIRRQASNVSSSTVQDRPRWDIGTRPPPVPAMPSMYQTPNSRRLSSFNGTRPFDLRSPSPSASSQASVARPPVTGSRIPVRSPPPSARSELLVPTLAQDRLTVPSGHRGPGVHSSAFQTPPRPRQSVPNSLPRSTTPLLGARSASHGYPVTPRTEPPRRSLARNPPSSFRANTPTPGRPSSRMSNASFAPVSAALKPFEPSKYDLLDQEVSRLISEVGFNLFVARLDPPLKKGQRKREDEEWKGEFVFGAGERSSGVKLLKMVGRGMDGGQARMKCMCRVAGAWHELTTVLNDRMARVPEAQHSP